MKYFKAQDFNLEEITSRLKEKNLTIGIVIPVYNEEKTIAQIISTFLGADLISNVYVIDDGSNDNTITKAETAGAIIFNRKEEGDLRYRNYDGKGFAIWEALSLAKEDILIVYDGDIKNPNLNHIVGLAAPLINDSSLVLTKAAFDRNLYLQDQVLKKEGGRITELLIKPLLGFLFPDLVLFQQPTGGLYGARKDKLAEIEILGEIGADISILVNLCKKNTFDSLCEVYIGEIIHYNKDLRNLSKISFKLIQSIFFLYKGVDNFKRYSYFSAGRKVDVDSPLIILEPKTLNSPNINKNSNVAKV
ncbi:glycosyltransferase, partial [Patescibacteria group bacterium]|nr:glycosyltransferase [Patescibacteria group bacterium]